MDKISYLSLAEIVPNKNNPRSEVDKNNLAELADSIRAVGIINPITVRVSNEDPTKYEIIAGERRFKAAEMAGLEKVPAIVKHLDDDQMMEIIIIENLQRKEVHPLDEAIGFDYLIRTTKYKNYESVGDRVGKSGSFVAKRISLLGLIDIVKEQFRKGEITLGHATEFARLNDKQQDKMVKWMENNKYSNPTANRLKEAIQQTFYLKIKDAVFDVEDDMLLMDLGSKHKYNGVLSCKMCPKRTGFNTNLFDDITDDVCTDPECYQTKVNAHIQKTKETYQDKGKPIVEYQHQDTNPKEGVLTKRSDLVIIGKDVKKCDSAVSAIVTKVGPYNYDFNKQVGDVIKVCNDPDCKVHKKIKEKFNHSTSTYQTKELSDADKKKIEKQRFEKQVNNLTEVRAITRLMPKIKVPLDNEFVNKIADEFCSGFMVDYDDALNAALEERGWTDDELGNFDLDKFFNKKSNKDRMLFIAELILREHSEIAQKFLKKHRIDVGKIKKEVRAELKLQEKEQAKAADNDKTIPENPEDEGYETDEEDED